MFLEVHYSSTTLKAYQTLQVYFDTISLDEKTKLSLWFHDCAYFIVRIWGVGGV